MEGWLCKCWHSWLSHVTGYYEDREPCMICDCQHFVKDTKDES